MAHWVDKRGPVNAATLYHNNALVAEGLTVNLPAIEFLTYDFRAMGTMTLPVVGLLNDMEASITKVGVDRGYSKLITPEPIILEYRWAQTVLKADNTSSEEGCRAYTRGTPKSIPQIAVNPGEAIEAEIAYAVTRYQLFANGTEVLLVDRIAGILRINGVDYMKTRNSLL